MAGDPWRVAVTRPQPKIARTERLLMARGFEPVSAPALAIVAHDDPAFPRILEDVERGEVDHVVFTGATGVRHAARRVQEADLGSLAEALEGPAVVAIGPRTASALEEAGLAVDAVPETHSSAGLIDWFASRDAGPGTVVALVRSTRGSPVLPKGLRDAGVEVREARVYDLVKPEPTEAHEALFAALEAGDLDAYVFTSSLTVEHFLRLADEAGPGEDVARERLRDAAVAAIGDPTRGTLEDQGVPVDVVPDEARMGVLADELAAYLRGTG